MNDKKAFGVDALPIKLLKRIGRISAYRMFCNWTTKKLDEKTNNILTTARLVFLSKTKSEVVNNHSAYRCLSIQPTMIRILERIILMNINKRKIGTNQFHQQAGFTKNKGCRDHILKLWEIIKKAKEERRNLFVGGIDVKAAYDGVSHEHMFEKAEKWRRQGYFTRDTLAQLRFIYSQYKLGLVEHKNGEMEHICLINKGVP